MSEHRVRIENKKDNIVLRSAVLDDAEILTKWWNDGRVMEHAGFPKGLNQSIEQTKKQIRNNDTKLLQTRNINHYANQILGNITIK